MTPRPIYHACSVSPEGIRQEVEVLKGDFNIRFKQSLFNALMVGYYVGIIPLFFAQVCLREGISMRIILLFFAQVCLREGLSMRCRSSFRSLSR